MEVEGGIGAKRRVGERESRGREAERKRGREEERQGGREVRGGERGRVDGETERDRRKRGRQR